MIFKKKFSVLSFEVPKSHVMICHHELVIKYPIQRNKTYKNSEFKSQIPFHTVLQHPK